MAVIDRDRGDVPIIAADERKFLRREPETAHSIVAAPSAASSQFTHVMIPRLAEAPCASASEERRRLMRRDAEQSGVVPQQP